MKANLSTRFFGLELKSPVIAASSSMTGNPEQIRKIAEAGAGAIVLKSIFEEEIYQAMQEELSLRDELHNDPEYLDYFDYVIKEDNLRKYVKLITDTKAAVSVPVIASISCTTSSEWVLFAKKLQEAGADGIELNLFIVPSDCNRSSDFHEHFYFETVTKVLESVTIPVSVKISHYFSNLAGMARKLSQTGIAGITVFNRFFAPDIDVENERIVAADVLSSENEYLLPLRWTGILSGKIDCDLAGTTGIHSAETALKFLLAGASAVQVASVLYEKGPEAITEINNGIENWMNEKGYHSIVDFKGKLNLMNAKNAVAFERVQFMKYFGEKAF
jgi:dihydroorotate dehydrogenase (fumarate)